MRGGALALFQKKKSPFMVVEEESIVELEFSGLEGCVRYSFFFFC